MLLQHDQRKDLPGNFKQHDLFHGPINIFMWFIPKAIIGPWFFHSDSISSNKIIQSPSKYLNLSLKVATGRNITDQTSHFTNKGNRD